jgi:GAF domain-containing protein
VSDLHNDPRHLGSSHPLYRQHGFFAGAPLQDAAGQVIGVLALHAPAEHPLTATENQLLPQLAQDLGKDAMALMQAMESAPATGEKDEPDALLPWAGPSPA